MKISRTDDYAAQFGIECINGWIISTLLLISLSGHVLAEESTLSTYETTLINAGLSPTADNLAGYLQQLHPTADQRSTALALIEELGSETFATRENATQRLLLMPVLDTEALARATSSNDPEVRWRAKKILAVGRPQTERLLFATFKTIEKNEFGTTVPHLLSAIPLCEQAHLRQAARDALVASVQREHAEVLTESASHDNAHVRAAATAALGSALGKEADGQLQAQLQDEDENVQLAAAWAMANYGSRESIAALLKLMQSDDVQIRTQSSLVLRALTNQNFAFAAYDSLEKRNEVVLKWQDWLATSGQDAELTFPVNNFGYGVSYLGGNMLLAYGNRNKVVELDPSGKEVWSFDCNGAWSAEKMANGNVLIASNRQSKVLEVDRLGKIVWEYSTPNPLNAKPLPNGNVLIAGYTQKKAIEVTRDKKVVWEHTAGNYVCDVHRLENGNTLLGVMNGATKIITPEGTTVWEYQVPQTYGCQPLANGNILIASLSGKVVEVTREKKEIWEVNEQNPADAFRLPNGNTLITGSRRFAEVTPDKKVVWSREGCQYGTARK